MARSEYLIVGAGFAGTVLARELVSELDCHVSILEARSHIAGNCHTERDPASQVMIHKFGPHIFNTNRRDVWDYVNKFANFMPFVNRVKAMTDRGVFSMPINLHTINQFFGKRLNPSEARDFIVSLGDKTIGEPANFEEQALKFLGAELYQTFFYGYTKKQWGCEPRNLPASILKRLPVRFDYNDNYYDSAFQGIPAEGYTEMIRRILGHDRIDVFLEKSFEREADRECDHLFYTGPLDSFFGFKFGRLGYRTVTFERIDSLGDLQGNAVINYPDVKIPFTRIHEHKHFAPWEKHEATVAFKEFSKETEPSDDPYYPKHLATDVNLLRQYQQLAEAEKSVSFLGRLGTYRYLNMDQVIGESLDFAAQFVRSTKEGKRAPVFSVRS
jgi:UDP-galactopyranose mutase